MVQENYRKGYLLEDKVAVVTGSGNEGFIGYQYGEIPKGDPQKQAECNRKNRLMVKF